jgi:hypothetical protein
MDHAVTNGLWIGAAIMVLFILFFLPFLLGRQNFHHRIALPIYNICNCLRRLWSQPRTTLFHTTIHLIESFCKAYNTSKKWFGRFHARTLRPHFKTTKLPVLPLHRICSQACGRSRTPATGTPISFFNLPFDIRILVYDELVRLFPRATWNITTMLKADPNFIHAMAFLRTCKLIREELDPKMFQSLKFETDTKYPFYNSLPATLTREIRHLSLKVRPSVDAAIIHHVVLQQFRPLQSLPVLTFAVTGRVLVDLDSEFQHILRRFKMTYRALKSIKITTSLTLPTPVDKIVLSEAMTRLAISLLPVFGGEPAFRASLWTQDVGNGRFRPARACKGMVLQNIRG